MGILSKQGIGLAALLMAMSILASRLMGLVRDKIIAHFFGASIEADIYFAAFIVPDFLHYLLAGGYVSITLIPLLSERINKDMDDAWRFLSTVLCWLTLAITLLTMGAFFIAPWFVAVSMPNFTPDEQARLVFFLRLILPAQIFFLPGACISTLLFVRKHFFIPALIPLLYNGGIIAGGLIWIGLGYDGMTGFCLGVTVGAFVGAFALPFWAVWRQEGGLQLRLIWRHPLLKRFLYLALPLMLGQSIVVLDEQFLRIFGALAGEGTVSLLSYSRRLMMVPVGVVAQAAAVASYPFLATLMARGDTAAFNETLGKALQMTLLVVLPITGILVALASPVLTVLFEGGHFTAHDTALATPLLQVMFLIVPFWAVQQLIGRAFYARQDTVSPALVGTLVTVAMLPVYSMGAEQYAALGVALASACGIVLYACILLLIWVRRHGWGLSLFMLRPLGRGLALTVPCAWLAHTVSAQMPILFASFDVGSWWLAWWALCFGGSSFVLAYLLGAYCLLPEIWTMIGHWLNKRKKAN